MLNTIDIFNYQTIPQLTIELNMGLVIISGESGSGKSVFIQSILWCLGYDGDTQHNDAQVSLSFNLDDTHPVKQWLETNELNSDDCIITRKKLASKRSRFTINHCPVPKSLVAELANHLLDIHGQHHHLSYLKGRRQQIILDNSIPEPTLLIQLTECYQQWIKLGKQIDVMEHFIETKRSSMELITYYIDELNQLNYQANEFDTLLQQQKQVDQHHRLCNTLVHLEQQFMSTNQKPLIHNLHQSQAALEPFHDTDIRVESLQQQIEQISLLIHECIEHTQQIIHTSEPDQSAATTKKRIQEIEAAARKYRCDPDELANQLHDFEEQKRQFDDYQTSLPVLKETYQAVLLDYQTISSKLSRVRKQSASDLSQAVTKVLHDLGMLQAQFSINVTHHPDQTPTVDGLDDISFLFSADSETLRPLSAGISGGELSRLALAIKSCHGEQSHKTLLFDEIDVGTSGHSANLIGQLLGKIGHQSQVISITHQPQVARYAKQHISVERNGKHTQITSLSETGRVSELVRMLSGKTSGPEAVAHAETLLNEIDA